MTELAIALMVLAPVLALARRFGLRQPMVVVTGLLATTLAFVPFPDNSAATYLHGIFGDISASTTVVLGFWVVHGLKPLPIGDPQRLYLSGAVALVGAWFYATATGLGSFDPYVLGYAPILLASIAAAICLVAIWAGWYLPATCLLAALIAFQLGTLPSINLWDYLIDPLLWVFTLGYLGVRIWRRYKETPHSA